MYDSPLAWCSATRCYAALDESPADCISRNQCTAGVCLLARYFAWVIPVDESRILAREALATVTE